jgi:predicted nucleic acid-binding protein
MSHLPSPSPQARRTVISDSSTLLFFEAIGILKLLRQLYGRVVVPDAVLVEIEIGRQNGEPGPDIASLRWMEVCSPPSPSPPLLVAAVGPKPLGAGEFAALGIALSLSSSYLVLDDKRARRTASKLGLQFTGMLGVLIQAKRAQLIPLVRAYIDKLKAAGAWLSGKDIARALEEAGEGP